MKLHEKIRLIAIYLPQYHPIPENDEWWGKGFTEWTNVVKARPLYEDHYQPHLPADLGYYDLRLPEVRQAQADLARQHGVYGFCYYHYWFNGKRLLERPLDEILQSGQPDFPFMICWANENWTRRWDGEEHEILMSQIYGDDDDVAHMRHLVRYFKDPRYIRVDNKPVLVLYKPFLLPDPVKTAQRWRSVAAEYGLELYLCHMVFQYRRDAQHLIHGFDAAIDFEPFGIRRTNQMAQAPRQNKPIKRFVRRIWRKVRPLKNNKEHLNIRHYATMFQNLKSLRSYDFNLFPMIVPGWDNTARRKHNPALILDNSTPEQFKYWLEIVKSDFKPYSKDENFIFINAWNEWAEGNHLEPCMKWGSSYLTALKNVFKESN